MPAAPRGSGSGVVVGVDVGGIFTDLVAERVAADGTTLTPVALDEVDGLWARWRADGMEAVAVCLLHAHANPAREQALGFAPAPHFPRHVRLSSEISAALREYERTCTAVLNAAVMPQSMTVDGGWDV